MKNAGSAGKAEAINYQSVKQKFQSYLKHPGSFAVYILTSLAALITVLVLGFIIVYILVKGVPHLTPDLFAWEYNSENVSMLPSISNTLLLTALALVIVVPIGIFSAIYMVEYAKKGNKIVSIVRVTAETLSGIPSIVYGLFGMIFFVGVCHFVNSLLAGALTVAIMVLPTVMRTTEEALLSIGAEILFHGIAIKPGMPTLAAEKDGVLFIGLSGNPFSAAIPFEMFVREILSLKMGDPDLKLRRETLTAVTGFSKNSRRRRFLRGKAEGKEVWLPDQQANGQMRSMVGCNCLIEIPAGSGPVKAGDKVEVLWL